MRQLLDNNADVEAKDRNGRTPLSYAAEKGWWAAANRHKAVVKLLESHVLKRP